MFCVDKIECFTIIAADLIDLHHLYLKLASINYCYVISVRDRHLKSFLPVSFKFSNIFS